MITSLAFLFRAFFAPESPHLRLLAARISSEFPIRKIKLGDVKLNEQCSPISEWIYT